MKNLLISIVAALILCTSSVASAGLVEKDVTYVIVRNPVTDQKKVFKFDGPTTVTRKTCMDDKKHECLYAAGAKRELYKITSDDVWITFAYAGTITIASN